MTGGQSNLADGSVDFHPTRSDPALVGAEQEGDGGSVSEDGRDRPLTETSDRASFIPTVYADSRRQSATVGDDPATDVTCAPQPHIYPPAVGHQTPGRTSPPPRKLSSRTSALWLGLGV